MYLDLSPMLVHDPFFAILRTEPTLNQTAYVMPNKLLILAVTFNAVIGQLLLKKAISAIGGRAAFSTIPKFLGAAAASPWVYLSVAVQGIGYVLWMLLISKEKLGVATASVAAGFYILVALSAWLIYDEALSLMQWLGVALIAAGVICISLKF